MPRHRVIIRRKKGCGSWGAARLIRRAALATLAEEGVQVPCEINVRIADDREIQEINRQFRQVDKPTDVLSFPAFSLEPGAFHAEAADLDPGTRRMPLGDMMLSWERAAEQGAAYGHSPEREAAYLTVHSVLHLLGYDHMDEGPEKRRMRGREKAVLRRLGFPEEG